MNRWREVDVAKGIAIVMLAFGIAHLGVVADPFVEGFGGGYRAASPIRFAARFVTTTTPPTFFALSGAVIGKHFADLAGTAKHSRWAQHLFARGVFLLFVELGLTQLYNLTHPEPGYVLIFEVLSAFGWCFIAIAVLRHLSTRAFVALAVALWMGAEVIALSGGLAPDRSAIGFASAALLTVADHPPWQVEYPIASWLPFMLLGAALGRAGTRLPTARRFAAAAAVLAVAFVLVRATTTVGSLGQAAPSTVQEFLQPTKYPVSPHYALLGLSGTAATIALAASLPRRVADWLTTFGRQPLLAFLMIKAFVALTQYAFDVRTRLGGLEGAFIVAAALVAVLPPLLRTYDRFKRTRRDRWIWLRLL